MNLAAVTRADPYAKDIVETSAHVAFYTFNYEDNEWEKTDVEGAFFVYSRNAEPFHSIFINNRLNTNSLVEPITADLELQSQPPFLLYRNERSRIRGFWFYNQEELERVAELINGLVKECQKTGGHHQQQQLQHPPPPMQTHQQQHQLQQQLSNMIIKSSVNNGPAPMSHNKSNNVNIFTMLSKAQADFNNSSGGKGPKNESNNGNHLDMLKVLHNGAKQNQNATASSKSASNGTEQMPSQSVMNFFASAKPTVMSSGHGNGQQSNVGVAQHHQQQPPHNMHSNNKDVVSKIHHNQPPPPLLQRMMSHPVTLEHIEKQQRAVTPQDVGNENGFKWANMHNNNNNKRPSQKTPGRYCIFSALELNFYKK